MFSLAVLQSCKPDDGKIQKEVGVALNSSPSTISTSVKGGVVTLTGTVASEAEKTAAEEAIKAIKDIKSIDNKIVVELPPAPVISPSDSIRMHIEAALNTAGFKDVKVEVSPESEITLTGNVKRADLKKVMQIANETKPKKVNNKLNTK